MASAAALWGTTGAAAAMATTVGPLAIGAAAMGLGGLGVPSRSVMGAVFGFGGVLLLPVLALTLAPILDSGSSLAAAAYLAVVPMFLGYVLFGRGLATVTASTATTVSLLEPAVAALIAVLVLDEHLPPLGWLGLALLFASLPTRPPTRSL